MPTLTETRLQVIAQKIDGFKSLRQCPKGHMSPETTREITAELQDIGDIVLRLPRQFKRRCSDVPWADFANWVMFSTSCVPSEEKLRAEISKLFEAESEISRQANSDNDIQKGIVQSLNNTNSKGSTEWYAHIQTSYLLVSLTLFAFLVRIQIDVVGFSRLQGVFYCLHATHILAVALEILWSPKIASFRSFSQKDYSTVAEFHDAKIEFLNQNNENIKKLLKNRETRRAIFTLYWVLTFGCAIIITIIDASKGV